MEVASTRSDIVVDVRDDGATMTLIARNPLVSWIVLLVGFFVSLGPLTILAYGLSVPNYGTVFVMGALTAVVFWLTWRIGWRPRPFRIAFSHGFLEVGQQRFPYSEIRSVGLASHGGAAFDPASMPLPRNHTIGPHIYIEFGATLLPITVGLREAQAREALRIFSHLLETYRYG